MKSIILSLLLITTTYASFAQKLPKQISESDFSIGKTIKIESDILVETRELNIYLPANYSGGASKTYPVIYLLDGSKDEDFIHIAGIVQFGSFSWIKMIPESIVVGIGNVDRKRDFTYPSNNQLDQKEFPTSGKSETFIEFIQKELQPFIDSTYKTTNEKTIIGQSLGGLLATEILFKKPDLFDNYIIVSPSLWWDDEKLLSSELGEDLQKKSVYIGVGKEGPVMERLAQSLFYKLSLEKKNALKLYFGFFEQQNHGDALHLAVYDAFEKLFKKKD